MAQERDTKFVERTGNEPGGVGPTDIVMLPVKPNTQGMVVADLDGRHGVLASTSSYGFQQSVTVFRSGSAHVQLIGSSSVVSVQPTVADAEFVEGLIISASHDAIVLQASGTTSHNIDWTGQLSAMLHSRSFNPTDVSGSILWLRSDAGVVTETGAATATGTTIVDRSGNDNHGTPTNMEDADFTTDTPGGDFSGYSADFSSDTNEQIAIGDVTPLKFDVGDAFSISAWIRTSTAAGQATIFAKRAGGGTAQGYELALTTTAAEPFFQLIDDVGVPQRAGISGSTSLDDDAWHHVIITKDTTESASNMTLYVDNTPDSNVFDDTFNSGGGTSFDTNQGAEISGRGGDGQTQSFEGKIDEVTVWNKELTAAEVTEVWNGGFPKDNRSLSTAGNIVGYWGCGEVGPRIRTWLDLTDTKEVLEQETNSRQPLLSSSLTVGGDRPAVTFDETDTSMKLSGSQLPSTWTSLHDGTGCTVFAAFEPLGDGVIFTTHNADANTIGMMLEIANTDELRARIGNGTGTWMVNQTTTTDVVPKGSTHVVRVSHGTAQGDDFQVWVDSPGSPDLQADYTGSPVTSGSETVMTIGNRHVGVAEVEVGAHIFELIMYDRLLDSGSINLIENYLTTRYGI